MLRPSSLWLSSLSARLRRNFGARSRVRQKRRIDHAAVQAAGMEALEPRIVLSAPDQWLQAGISGGGVLLEPAINPYNPNEFYIGTDMSQMFHSKDAGQSWDFYNFNEFVTSNRVTGVQFTSDPQVLFAIDQSVGAFPTPLRSTDAGATWHRPGTPEFPSDWNTIAGGSKNERAWRLYSDPGSPGRLIVETQDKMFLSVDAGATFQLAYKYTGTVSVPQQLGLHLAGAFFDGPNIYAATNAGLVVSSNGGVFVDAGVGGIPAGEAIISFAGASDGTTTRFWAITHDPTTIHTPLDHGGANATGTNLNAGFKNIYTLDVGNPNWTVAATGLPANVDLSLVTMATNDIDTVYVGGGATSGNLQSVYVGRYTTARPAWTSIYETQSPGINIETDYVGPGGHLGFSPAIEGLTVNTHDSSELIVSDGWGAHFSTDGGTLWQQVTVPTGHAPGTLIDPTEAYSNVGINDTTVWWIAWQNEEEIFAAYDDLKWQRSTDGGETWSFDVSGLNQKMENFSIETGPNGRMYMAQGRSWAPHDILGLPDSAVTQGGGDIVYSDDGGATWQLLYNFQHPVSWTAIDPRDPNTMYASVVDPKSGSGGVWVTHNLDAVDNGGVVHFDQLAAQPDSLNVGKPHTIEVLNDGTIVLVLTARKGDLDGSPQTPDLQSAGSGVFRLDPGATEWVDVTGDNMHYWCKDLVIDPADPEQSTWFVAVNPSTTPNEAVQGQPANQPGLYLTTNRGETWVRVFTQSVDSLAINPNDHDEAYLTTTSGGLYYTSNLHLADGVTANPQATFTAVTSFPHKRPNRVFFNPYVPGEVWVATNGAGIFIGNSSTPTREFNFLMSDFVVDEGVGTATILVERTGSVANSMSVDFVVQPGSASTADFTTIDLQTGITGTLTFLPGQAVATFLVPIVDDADIETDETVLLSLSGPIGGNVLGAASSAVLTIQDNDQPNVAPVITNVGDVTVSEGQTATNSGTWSDTNASDIVTLSASSGTVTKNANGTWSWSLGTDDGPDESRTVTITADDGNGGVTMTSFDLTVTNVAPTSVDINGLSSAYVGDVITVTLSAADVSSADQAAGFTYQIDWDGNGSTDETVSGASGLTVNHIFTAGGMTTVTVNAIDKDGGTTAASASYTIYLIQRVNLDIKPGNTKNNVNVKSQGVIPVTIYTTSDFDAATINGSTIQLAGVSARNFRLQDVDNDGDLDLVLQFNTQAVINALGVSLDSGESVIIDAELTGQTIDDVFIQGFDTIEFFQPGKGKGKK